MQLKYLLLMGGLMALDTARAQTDADGLMMNPKQLCAGFVGQTSSWTNYWEGTLKRSNENLGRITTNSVAFMANYGLAKKWNLLVAVPYVATKASAGTLMGLQGIQDGEIWLKYQPLRIQKGTHQLNVLALAGGSAPLSNYTPDFLPLSIGLQSVRLQGRLMLDYQYKRFFATAHGTYTHRRNIELDRTAYYTDRMMYSSEVYMPDQLGWQFRTGYRKASFIAEAIASRMVTLGGFDITRNNMPFASNRMNATMVGTHLKYYLPGKLKNISVDGMYQYTVAGRNVGQAQSAGLGVFYLFSFAKKGTEPASPTNLQP